MPNLIGPMIPFLSLIVFLVIVVGVIKVLTAGRKQPESFPYEKDDPLFSPSERSFLGVLEQVVGEQYRVFGKVRLADLIRVKRGTNNSARQSAFNQIQSKHVDFVACDPNDLTVQFVVELDDKSHASAKGQSRDAFLNQALAAAGIPLFRFPAKRAYALQEIQDAIFQGEETNAEPSGKKGTDPNGTSLSDLTVQTHPALRAPLRGGDLV